MSIGVAILGGGIFAREEHVPAVHAAKDLTLKAVYSRSLKSAKSLETGDDVDVYSEDSGEGKNLDALLARDDIHAVIIALTILGQPEFIKKAILAGKHVLSEKPIAKDLATARDLIGWFQQNNPKKVTWGIAENNRFLATVDEGRAQVQKLGKIYGFSLKLHAFAAQGKYFETPWRKTPEYQGGFLLDGGVHNIATLRKLLGEETIDQVSAFSAQLQPELPPVDTISATLKTKSGVPGTLYMSFGVSFPRRTEYAIAGEKGSILVDYKSVTFTDREGKSDVKEIADERTGVPPEIRAWGEGLAAGKPNKQQSPEEALADLEVIEKLLRSGENDGTPMRLSHQGV